MNDLSGILRSDHPVPGQGWIKGWLPAAGKRRVGIVCAHSNPSTVPLNNRVFCINRKGRKVERQIIVVSRLALLPLESDLIRRRNVDGDVALVLFNKPFPPSCATYKPGPAKGKVSNINKRGECREFSVKPVGKSPWVSADKRSAKRFEAGDSGTVWWAGNRIVSHTALGFWGEGPDYARAWPQIETEIRTLLEL
jgi:hypothetical protein